MIGCLQSLTTCVEPTTNRIGDHTLKTLDTDQNRSLGFKRNLYFVVNTSTTTSLIGCFQTSTTHRTVRPSVHPTRACCNGRRPTVVDNTRSRVSAVNTTLAIAVAARMRRKDGRTDGRSSKPESGHRSVAG
uniref:Uncharacterized protein n=1 Tax=Haemonchus contortus TaxID=6289 RepID=A0A7I4XZX6_HAECO